MYDVQEVGCFPVFLTFAPSSLKSLHPFGLFLFRLLGTFWPYSGSQLPDTAFLRRKGSIFPGNAVF
jgi:hypothetical protein